MKIRTIGLWAALVVPVWANADQMYSGTWEVGGKAAGTVTLRVRDDGTVTGAVVGNTGDRVSGHLRGTFEGKRFNIVMRLRNKGGMQFQGNFTHNEAEAHMDGLQYIDNKPVDNVKLTVNAITISSGRR